MQSCSNEDQAHHTHLEVVAAPLNHVHPQCRRRGTRSRAAAAAARAPQQQRHAQLDAGAAQVQQRRDHVAHAAPAVCQRAGHAWQPGRRVRCRRGVHAQQRCSATAAAAAAVTAALLACCCCCCCISFESDRQQHPAAAAFQHQLRERRVDRQRLWPCRWLQHGHLKVHNIMTLRCRLRLLGAGQAGPGRDQQAKHVAS